MEGKCLLNALRELIFFKNKNPNLPLPPAPIVTRKGAWLSAVLYYPDTVDELDKDCLLYTSRCV